MRKKFTDRTATAYISLNTHRCTACWKCIGKCPEKVIGKIDFIFHKHAVIQNASACIGCMKCIKTCESGAINKI